MSEFVPDTYILCENCYNFFVAYEILHSEIDADKRDFLVRDSYKGKINRIVCPLCNTEFTFEAPVLFHSGSHKFVIAASYPDYLVDIGSFPLAAKISGMESWKFRRCEFAMDACEKIRIFKCGLDDAKITLLKLKSFENYRDMRLEDEYIVFEKISQDKLVFTHRDFTDKVISTLYVEKAEYDKLNFPSPKTGDWIYVDRDRTIKLLEDKKK